MRAFIFLLTFLVLAGGCSPGEKKADRKELILVSILPQKTFIEKIAGEDFDISVLIPHGANPVTYSLLPAQMEEISRAAVWFRMGHVGFEFSWGDKIIQTNPALKVTDLSMGLELIAASKDDQTGELKGVDPHTWLSPSLVREMASTILQELSVLNPEKKANYQSNYQEFIKEIEFTDQQVRTLLAEFRGRKFISFHPSLSYFARDYGLEQYSLEQRGKEPTPGHVAGLIDLARSENIRVIYIQSDFDRENAAMFAREIDGEAIQVWPLNPEWSKNLISMATLLSQNFR